MSNDNLVRFSAALKSLLAAARSYLSTQKTEDDLNNLRLLYTELQLAAPLGVTIPLFRREIWPLDSVEYYPASTDGGKTYQPWPQYRRTQRGSWETCRHWMAELGIVAEAVRRQMDSPVNAQPDAEAKPPAATNPQAAPKRKAMKDRKSEARDKWIYKKCCKGVPHDKIVAELKKIASKRGWRIVTSKQRIQQIGNEYADRHELKRPPSRQNL